MRQQKSRRSGSGSLRKIDESPYLTIIKVKRENYNQPIFKEPESTCMRETDQQLQFDHRSQPGSHPDTSQLEHSEPSHPVNSLQARVNKRKKPPGTSPRAEAQSWASLTRKAEQHSNAPKQLSSQPPSRFDQDQDSKSSQRFGGDVDKPCAQKQDKKKYGCINCLKKFERRNDASRHQDAVHRRTKFWSCAVLSNDFTAAFFPSASIPPSNPSPAQQSAPQELSGHVPTAVCAYCEDEFMNEPADWEQRRQHLLTQHKFGKCDQTKQFYRVDSFRRHLKRSHGFKNGKHTPLLVQACAQGEPQPIQAH
ncbi:MAG: hypothetical protein Q9164_007165 [Protoblastenia rupestris]